jgi:hypothetical protein
LESIKDKGIMLEDYIVFQYFRDEFLDEAIEIPPKGYIDLSIDLVPRDLLVSTTPYRMSTLELLDMKM